MREGKAKEEMPVGRMAVNMRRNAPRCCHPYRGDSFCRTQPVMSLRSIDRLQALMPSASRTRHGPLRSPHPHTQNHGYSETPGRSAQECVEELGGRGPRPWRRRGDHFGGWLFLGGVMGGFWLKSPRRPLTRRPTPVPTKAPNGPKKMEHAAIRRSIAPRGTGVPGGSVGASGIGNGS